MKQTLDAVLKNMAALKGLMNLELSQAHPGLVNATSAALTHKLNKSIQLLKKEILLDDVAKKAADRQDFLNKLINAGKYKTPGFPEFTVVFYDQEPLTVYAPNFTYAGVLAMAYIMHDKGVGFAIQYIQSARTGNRIPFDVS